MKYNLAKNPVFFTRNGEGHLRGLPMVFVRLAGCSVGCALCDTDYRLDSQETPGALAERALQAFPDGMGRERWVWITGGEPTDQDLRPLILELRERNLHIAVATSGHRPFVHPVDWLSVSPHDPSKWIQTFGSELKLVLGLSGYHPNQFLKAHPDSETDFMFRYIQPLSTNGHESPESVASAIRWLENHPNWGISRQDHLHWNVP